MALEETPQNKVLKNLVSEIETELRINRNN